METRTERIDYLISQLSVIDCYDCRLWVYDLLLILDRDL